MDQAVRSPSGSSRRTASPLSMPPLRHPSLYANDVFSSSSV